MALVDSLGDTSGKIKFEKRLKPLPPVLNFFKNFCLVLFFSAICFGVINLPAYFKIYQYRINPEAAAFEQSRLAQLQAVQAQPVKQYQNNTLLIPKIGVEAPIIWDIGSGEVMSKLQDGLVQLAGSGHPDEGKNIFITGHSSNYWWRGGSYNTVFALLPQLQTNDEIYVVYQGKIKRYQVKETKELKKNEVNQYLSTDSETLTLMTCVPVGTNLHRLLVIAKPISTP